MLNATRNLISEYTKWEVIDGQQRLTTINILLSCLKKPCFYSVEYQTRKESKGVLDNITSYKFHPDSDIDSYHMLKARDTINSWLENHKEDDLFNKENFLRNLLEKEFL